MDLYAALFEVVLCKHKWKCSAFLSLFTQRHKSERIMMLIIRTCWGNWNCHLHWTYFSFIFTWRSNLLVWYLSASLFLSFCAGCANCEHRWESGIPGSTGVVSNRHVQPLPVRSTRNLLLHCVGERPQHQAAWRECPHRHPRGQHLTPHRTCVKQGSVGFTSFLLHNELNIVQINKNKVYIFRDLYI